MPNDVGVWRTTTSIRNHPITKPTYQTTDHSKTKIAVKDEQSKRRVQFVLRHTSKLKAKEPSQRWLDMPSESPVLIYRTPTKIWEGP